MNQKWINIIIFVVCLAFIFFYVKVISSSGEFKKVIFSRTYIDYDLEGSFEGFNNESGTSDGHYIVPNYVHFIRFGLGNISFMDAVCILAALKHQAPEKLFIHTDEVNRPLGKYWDVIAQNKHFNSVIVFKKAVLPKQIFGKDFSEAWGKWHGGDVMRIRILMKYGGIFLDNDSYIVRSLNNFRRYEMTLGWMQNSNLASQVVIAHKNARFLRKWLESYREYNATQWYYNAGVKPTKDILEKKPYLVHREKLLLANHHITYNVYYDNWTEWRTHYAIHLLYHHQYLLKSNISSVATYPVSFDEYNIVNYPVTIKDMVYDVYPIPS